MLYVFQLKLIYQWNFRKLEVTFLAELYRKKIFGFLWKQLKLKFFLYFCFDSFDSFKVRSEKHEVLAN